MTDLEAFLTSRLLSPVDTLTASGWRAIRAAWLVQTRLNSGNPDQGFAEIPARQHVDESARRRLQALADILAVADLTGSDEWAQFLEEAVIVISRELCIDESPDQKAAPEDSRHRLCCRRTPGWIRIIVTSDLAADGDAGVAIEQRQDGITDHCYDRMFTN